MTNPTRKRVVTLDDLNVLNQNAAYARQKGEEASAAAQLADTARRNLEALGGDTQAAGEQATQAAQAATLAKNSATAAALQASQAAGDAVVAAELAEGAAGTANQAAGAATTAAQRVTDAVLDLTGIKAATAQTVDRALAGIAQAEVDLRQTAGVYSRGRMPQAGDPAGTYRHDNTFVEWSGSAVSNVSPVLLSVGQNTWSTPPIGATGAGFKVTFDPASGLFQNEIPETIATNDDMGYLQGENPDVSRGVANLRTGRGNLTDREYCLAVGHNNRASAAASAVIGAGNCVGNPNDPHDTQGQFWGYCTTVSGKNNVHIGQKGFTAGQNNKTYGDLSINLGFGNQAGTSDLNHRDVFVVTIGSENTAQGTFAGRGPLVQGHYLNARKGCSMTGTGLSAASPLSSSLNDVYAHYHGMRGDVYIKTALKNDYVTALIALTPGTPEWQPEERIELVTKPGQCVTHVLNGSANDGQPLVEVYQVLKGDGSNQRLTLFERRITPTNGGSPTGTYDVRAAGAASAALAITDGNRVGIGHDVPTDALDVYGNVRVRSGVLKLAVWTRATLPSAAVSGAGARSAIGDAAAGKTPMVYSNGNSWCYEMDGSVV